MNNKQSFAVFYADFIQHFSYMQMTENTLLMKLKEKIASRLQDSLNSINISFITAQIMTDYLIKMNERQ